MQSQLQELGLDPSNIQQEQNADVAVGNVISLDPGEGSEVAVGTQVTITVSTGEGDTMTRIPDVRGYEEAEAVQIVENQGLIANVEHSYSESAGVGYGQVYEMTPQGGQRIEQGSIITLRVLTEPEETESQSEDTETTGTSTETSSSTSSASRDLSIIQPDSYDGQSEVRIRLVSAGQSDTAAADGGTVILQDQTLSFTEDSNGNMVYDLGNVQYGDGDVLYFDVKDDSGNYSTIWSYNLTVNE